MLRVRLAANHARNSSTPPTGPSLAIQPLASRRHERSRPGRPIWSAQAHEVSRDDGQAVAFLILGWSRR
jgi:hypothetical protein